MPKFIDVLPLALAAASFAAAQPSPEPAPCVPVNPHATPEARALLKNICDLSGKSSSPASITFPDTVPGTAITPTRSPENTPMYGAPTSGSLPAARIPFSRATR